MKNSSLKIAFKQKRNRTVSRVYFCITKTEVIRMI